eukprot:CAMPEP_0179007062 /NCGR_PEP_ID=MMETSP0795-20121207/14932_1 /TAXON_ID=88552 /ORGANISM="Amoebophrya sp., Strain Ameob2" /LENGTH=694 /DNA_ID=CAMNT_0020701955 /DNA_START=187 /DNA_END=2271 /DNA_ORIENTATION=-
MSTSAAVPAAAGGQVKETGAMGGPAPIGAAADLEAGPAKHKNIKGAVTTYGAVRPPFSGNESDGGRGKNAGDAENTKAIRQSQSEIAHGQSEQKKTVKTSTTLTRKVLKACAAVAGGAVVVLGGARLRVAFDRDPRTAVSENGPPRAMAESKGTSTLQLQPSTTGAGAPPAPGQGITGAGASPTSTDLRLAPFPPVLPRSLSRSRVHLVVLTDENFAKQYKEQIQTLRCYANYWGYKFESLPVDMKSFATNATRETEKVRRIPLACPEDAAITHELLFRRHCLVAGYLKEIAGKDDAVFLLDADIVARKLTPNIDRWTAKMLEEPAPGKTRPDIAFFERIWALDIKGEHAKRKSSGHNEIMAGSYLARNTKKTRTFLMQWANMAKKPPPGFSSADNGAIHLAIPRALGISTKKCEDEFFALTGHITGNEEELKKKNSTRHWNDELGPYSDFVSCCREELGMGSTPHHEAEARVRGRPELVHQDSVISGISIAILAKDGAWAPDWGHVQTEEKKAKTPLVHGMKDMDEKAAQDFLAWKDLPLCVDKEGTSLHGVASPDRSGRNLMIEFRPELFGQEVVAAKDAVAKLLEQELAEAQHPDPLDYPLGNPADEDHAHAAPQNRQEAQHPDPLDYPLGNPADEDHAHAAPQNRQATEMKLVAGVASLLGLAVVVFVIVVSWYLRSGHEKKWTWWGTGK